MKTIVSTVATALAAAMLPSAALAAHAPDHVAAAASSTSASSYTEGEVKKIDKDAGKVTLKHGPIENLGMPGMTMVFRAKDPASLDRVKVGDTVKFKAERIDGAFTVTELRQGS